MEDFASESEFLQHYDIHDYPIPLLTVDMSIFMIREETLHVLLVHRQQFPAKNCWALPGGFVDLTADHNLEDAAQRKLAQKTGVSTPYLEQVCSVGGPDRDPRAWSVTVCYMALIADPGDHSLQGDSQWMPLQQAQSQLNAFDHKELLQRCHERLISKVEYTALPVNFLPPEFTLSELQASFEVILDKKIEKKSFRRRVLDAGILEETGAMRKGANRPAKLYRLLDQGNEHCFSRNLLGPRTT